MLCPGGNCRWDIPSDGGTHEEPTKVPLMEKHQLSGAHLTHLKTLISSEHLNQTSQTYLVTSLSSLPQSPTLEKPEATSRGKGKGRADQIGVLEQNPTMPPSTLYRSLSLRQT